jgi:enoyl-CoA hydratase/carnithine racemase
MIGPSSPSARGEHPDLVLAVQGRVDSVKLERDGGVIQVTLHTDGGPFVFSEPAHRELGAVFTAVGADSGNRVVILTGTGESFCSAFD